MLQGGMPRNIPVKLPLRPSPKLCIIGCTVQEEGLGPIAVSFKTAVELSAPLKGEGSFGGRIAQDANGRIERA